MATTSIGDFWIGEDNHDDHGYTSHDTGHVAPIDLVTVRFSSDFATERNLFADFGYAADGADDGEYVELTGSTGAIGLHATADHAGEPTADAAISFVTEQDLDELASRLVAAGYGDAEVRDDGMRALYVTDPDGRETQVWPSR